MNGDGLIAVEANMQLSLPTTIFTHNLLFLLPYNATMVAAQMGSAATCLSPETVHQLVVEGVGPLTCDMDVQTGICDSGRLFSVGHLSAGSVVHFGESRGVRSPPPSFSVCLPWNIIFWKMLSCQHTPSFSIFTFGPSCNRQQLVYTP